MSQEYDRNEEIRPTDRLGTAAESGAGTEWDWKGNFVDTIGTGADKGEGLERFSQFSATPDTTILMAGPCRFSGLSGNSSILIPIGMADGLSINGSAQLARLYELGSNRPFFTRGKTNHSLSLTRMLADTKNLLAALSQQAYRPLMNVDGSKAPGAEKPNPEVMMNLDSEYFSVPFGLLMVMKTRGGSSRGKVLTAGYLENCMFANYAFSVSATAPVIAENIAIEFDRLVPVSLV